MSQSDAPADATVRSDVGRPVPGRDVLEDLRRAAAAKWRGDPAAQQFGLFARAAAEIERLRAELRRVQAYIDETPELFEALGPLDHGPNDRIQPRR